MWSQILLTTSLRGNGFEPVIAAWGYEADAAVYSYVAKTKLNCNVVQKDLKEQVSWAGFGTGEGEGAKLVVDGRKFQAAKAGDMAAIGIARSDDAQLLAAARADIVAVDRACNFSQLVERFVEAHAAERGF